MLQRRAALSSEEAANLTRFHLWHERALVESMKRFFRIPERTLGESAIFFRDLDILIAPGRPRPAPIPQGDGRLIFRRNAKIKGPMGAFGYDYFSDHYGAERESTLRLMRFQGLRGSGGDYAYEVLNFVDGKRSAQEIRDFVSATYGPIPLDVVVEYLRALESISVIKPVK